jgi:hypothetical protein
MMIDSTKKIKNKTLAISMAEPAIRVNPNSAATIAITKNVAAHLNIAPSSFALPTGNQAAGGFNSLYYFTNLFSDLFNVFSCTLYIFSRASGRITS